MSFKDPKKFFTNDMEAKEWTTFTALGSPGVANGVKIGPDGKVGACTGLTFKSISNMHKNLADGRIDLTKCISWAYKILWEALWREGYKDSKISAGEIISRWNKIEQWSAMAHFDPSAREWNQEEILKEIFDQKGMGILDELSGYISKGGALTINSGKLFENLGDSEIQKIKNLEKKDPKVFETVISPEGAAKWASEEGLNAGAVVSAMFKLSDRKGETFPYKKFVFTPIRRFKNEGLENINYYQKPQAPKWLDKWCLQYVESNYRAWWFDSPVAGEQHGWVPKSGGASANVYRKESKRSPSDWIPKKQNLRKEFDPLIQQTLEYEPGWYSINNDYGRLNKVAGTFKSKDAPYPTFYSVYNPYTIDGDVEYDKSTWLNRKGTKFLTWKPGFTNKSNRAITWVEKKSAKPNDNSQFNNGLYRICYYAKNTDSMKAHWYDSQSKAWDLSTALKTIRLGPTDDGRQTLKNALDKMFEKDLGMGRTEKTAEKDLNKFNIRQPAGKRQNLRQYLLDPLFQVQTNKPWMMWSLRMVLYVVDCANKGVFKNLKHKPFDTNSKTGPEFLKFLISIIWEVFSELEVTRKIIDKAQSQNNKVSPESRDIVKQKDLGKQIQKNMQCFMLNLVDHFESYHKDTKNSKIIANYEFLRISGENTNIFNLIGYKPKAINRMLNIKPHQLALMQPRIKLFKERRITRPNGKFDTYIVEVEGPFSTHTNTKNLQDMLQSGGGRSMGAGIKEIVFKQSNGDRDFEVEYQNDVDITFVFNTMQEIFLNFPSFDEKGKASFPYGVDPKYAALAGSNDKEKLKRIPASYAELVFPINTKDGDYLASLSQTEETANVVLEIGWSLPEDIKKLNAEDSIFFKNLSEQTLFKSYVLNPFDSEFNFTNEGQVELIARYHGIERILEANPKNKLFPLAGIAGAGYDKDKKIKTLKNNKKIKDSVKKIQKLEKEKNKGKILTRSQDTELRINKDIVRREVLYTKSAQYDDYIEKQLSTFLEILFKDDKSIYTVEVPKAFLGAREDKNILKWSPTRDIAALRKFPRTVHRGLGQTVGSNKKVAAAIKEGQKKANDDASKEKMEKEIKEVNAGKGTEDEKKAKIAVIKAKYEKNAKVSTKHTTIKKAAKSALKTGTAGYAFDKDFWNIHFVFFGDLMQSVLSKSYEDFKIFAEYLGLKNFLGPEQKLNYILGTVVVPIIKGDEQVLYSINLADLPITLHHFSNFVVEQLISPEAYNMTRFDFIKGLLKSMIREYFNSDCFVGEMDIQNTSPQIILFSMPSLNPKDKKGDGSGGLWKLSGMNIKGAEKGVSYTKDQLKVKMKKFESEARANIQSISKRPHYKYAFLGTRGATKEAFNKKIDFDNNIHHFYFGAGEGLVKNVSFKSEDLHGQTESLLLEGITAVNPQATAFIPRLFNCSLTMVGNTLFEPGQTFFVDPTMGTMVGQVGKGNNKTGINVIRDTGLGGYFYIASTETRIAPGVYETVLEGIKTGVIKKTERRTHAPASKKEIDENKVPATKPASPDAALGKRLKAATEKRKQKHTEKEAKKNARPNVPVRYTHGR